VVKLLPPLTISSDEIDEGLDIIRECVNTMLAQDKEIL
jgi:diaminobutyrate-2-oxoglutarate transaminase